MEWYRLAQQEVTVVTETVPDTAIQFILHGIDPDFKTKGVSTVQTFAPGRGVARDGVYVSSPLYNKGSFGPVRIHIKVPFDWIEPSPEMEDLGYQDTYENLDFMLTSPNGALVREVIPPDRIFLIEYYDYHDGKWRSVDPKEYLETREETPEEVRELMTPTEYENKLKEFQKEWHLTDDKVYELVHRYRTAPLREKYELLEQF